MNNKTLRDPSVVVVGAGMTGILLTIKLREAGITNITVLEKTDKVGGTWRENTYPGVACDIPSHMYTYSFEPNPEWSHLFAYGEEIQEYFEKVGRKYGVTDAISFQEAVVDCIYDNGQWTVTTSKGRTIVADFVINSTGILHHPAKPKFEGMELFKGDVFHTAEWDHSIDLKGKKVGIIGTGSTAAQVIPAVAETAGKLTVFQRTPQWVLPFGNKEFKEEKKAKLRANPAKLLRLRKTYNWALAQLLTKAVIGKQPQRFVFSEICKRYMKSAVKDPVLREKLTPDYAVGCKRIVISSTYIPAMQRDNVDVVSSGVSELNESGVVTQDDTLHDLDVLILATGFNPVAYMRPMNLVGKDGLKIDTAWEKKIQNYRSICMPGFPNNFLMLGPNSPIGNYSVIEMSEVQTDYILKLIDHWRHNEFDAIEPKPSAIQRFAEYIRAGMKNTVWVGGCQSWYLDGDGDPILWPYSFAQWVEEMSEPDLNDFELTKMAKDNHVSDETSQQSI